MRCQLPVNDKSWSRDITKPLAGDLPQWMIELAEQVGMIEPGALLPTGVIAGSTVIENVTKEVVASGQLSVKRIRIYWQLTTHN
jgi:hypothetical protein